MSWLQKKASEEATGLASQTLAERESTLWAASNKYMSGEITLQDLQEIEQPYLALEYEKCMGTFSPESQPFSLLTSVAQFFKFH